MDATLPMPIWTARPAVTVEPAPKMTPIQVEIIGLLKKAAAMSEWNNRGLHNVDDQLQVIADRLAAIEAQLAAITAALARAGRDVPE
jgi:hypothetical protein